MPTTTDSDREVHVLGSRHATRVPLHPISKGTRAGREWPAPEHGSYRSQRPRIPLRHAALHRRGASPAPEFSPPTPNETPQTRNPRCPASPASSSVSTDFRGRPGKSLDTDRRGSTEDVLACRAAGWSTGETPRPLLIARQAPPNISATARRWPRHGRNCCADISRRALLPVAAPAAQVTALAPSGWLRVRLRPRGRPHGWDHRPRPQACSRSPYRSPGRRPRPCPTLRSRHA